MRTPKALVGLFALTLLSGVVSACDGGSPSTTPIAELPDGEAVALCEEFITKACAAAVIPADDPACNTCDPCGQAMGLASLRAHCGEGITLGGVRACVDSGFDRPTCTGPQRGGCVFDVGDELCPQN